MTIKVIIFDFDGTIADTHDALVRITNRLSTEFGFKPLEPEELTFLKNLSSREIIKKSQISPLKIFFLLRRVRTELGKEIRTLQPVTGIENSLKELKKQGYQLGIVTSNCKENVIAFLENNNLDSIFSFIYTDISLFGKHKVLNQIIRQYNFRSDEIAYVGDETRDIHCARKSGTVAIAVGWGFNSPLVLAAHQPDYLIEHPQKLVEAIKKPELVTSEVLHKA
jgi:phosphoglycolate phosphatase